MLVRWLAWLRVPRYTVFPSRSRCLGGAHLFGQMTPGIASAAGRCNRWSVLPKTGMFAFVVRVPNQQIRLAEFPFNREQCWEFATRVRAEFMASIAFHAGLFRYSRLPRQIRSGIYQGSVPG
jgi:hypothetical protein